MGDYVDLHLNMKKYMGYYGMKRITFNASHVQLRLHANSSNWETLLSTGPEHMQMKRQSGKGESQETNMQPERATDREETEDGTPDRYTRAHLPRKLGIMIKTSSAIQPYASHRAEQTKFPMETSAGIRAVLLSLRTARKAARGAA